MISDDKRALIRRLHVAEHWPVGTIAAQLGLHRDTVTRALELDADASWVRPSRLDPYKALILEVLDEYPKLRATRLHEMMKSRGYPGGVAQLRRFVRRVRPRPQAEAYLRLRTLPGEQGQVDWGSFGKLQVGRAKRTLSLFVMALSWSRGLYGRFFLDQQGPSFRRGHVLAFERFKGVPREILYDNLKSAVTERSGDHVRFHPALLELAGHYHFAPKPCAPARGNEKGKVERRIRYVRDSFFAARDFRDLDDLNEQFDEWITSVAHQRMVPDGEQRVAQALDEERPRLLALPAHPLDCDEVITSHSGKTPYIRFDLNDYSIPHDRVRESLIVKASPSALTISTVLGEVVAEHRRSWSRGEQIEDERHLAALTRAKVRARELRGRDRLRARCPSADRFIEALARRNAVIGTHTRRLLDLLDRYGEAELESALQNCIDRGAVASGSVAHVLDQRARARGQAPPVDVVLPDDDEVRNLDVEAHDLTDYDDLGADHGRQEE